MVALKRLLDEPTRFLFPDAGAVAEAARAAGELRELGIANQHLVINGVFEASDPDDDTAAGLQRRHDQVLRALPAGLAELPSDRLPLLSGAPLGAPALRDLLDGVSPVGAHGDTTDLATTSMSELADGMAATGHGLVMAMGTCGCRAR